jgi:large subunit ribosomal protein L5e
VSVASDINFCFGVFDRDVLNVSCILQIESMYKAVHQAIRTDPARIKAQKEAPSVPKRWNRAKLSLSERKNRIAQKKESWKKKLEAGEVDA